MEKFRYKLTFSKELFMIYLSHLDLMRLFSRALRRSGLPLFITNGFNPHPKISFERALKLGQTSEREVAHIFLKTRVDEAAIKDCLTRQLPDGITLKEVGETYD